MMSATRTVSSEAAQVLEHLAAERRRTVLLPGDSHWLRQVTPHYHKLLERMTGHGSLYRLARGRYVVAPRATQSLAQAAPPEMIVDLLLRGQGEYYLGFFSAFAAHRLTDLHSSTMFAAIRQGAATDMTAVELPHGQLQLIRLSLSRWPQSEQELERVRVEHGMREFAWRSTLERTLVDGLLRPDLCAGIETVIGGWARAAQRDDTDWPFVWEIARRSGTAVARRAAYLLTQIGQGALIQDELGPLRRRGGVTLLDRTNGYAPGKQELTRDASSGLTLNVPEAHVQGWLSGAAIG